MQIYSKIDKGFVRTTNQDAYFAGELEEGTVFAVVCDGMGGANAGNVASEAAVKAISEYIIKSYRNKMDDIAVSMMLKRAIASANIEIYDMALKNSNLSGMGTTTVTVFVNDDFCIVAHVGDSRAYLVNDTISQITKDHSVVQSLIESGKLTPEEAKVHPRKNVITRAIGAEEDVETDCENVELNPGQTLLICTDGLTNFADNSEILNVFNSSPISEVADRLVNLANKNGGGDNITVVTITR